MALRSRLLKLRPHPATIALVCIALGAAIAVCIVGVPSIWSAEAAGWASAIGTLSAVAVALALAKAENRRRRRESADQARGLSALLLTTLVDWERGISNLAHHVKMKRPMAITESFEKEGGDVLAVPSVVLVQLERLHMLGSASAPLSQAVVGAMNAKRMEYAVREAVRDYRGENIDVIDAFERHVAAVSESLRAAIDLIQKNLKGGSGIR